LTVNIKARGITARMAETPVAMAIQPTVAAETMLVVTGFSPFGSAPTPA